MGFQRFKFTWTNNQLGENDVQEHLDWFFVCEEWMSSFVNFQVKHLVLILSDHCSIFMYVGVSGSQMMKKKRVFRVEEVWFQDESCLHTSQKAWDQVSYQPNPFYLHEKLRRCREALSGWELSHFGNVTR